MSRKTKRIIMALAGVILTGLSVGTIQKATLGTDPFTCFVVGIANLFGSGYGTFYPIVMAILLIGVFLIDKHYIGIATIFNLVGIGPAAGFMRAILDGAFPDPRIGLRILILLAGLAGSCFSASLYFTADLGVSGYDAVSLIAANRYKLAAFRLCRIASDLVCVIVGFLLHANVGIGTVITAFCMGPVIQWFNLHVSEPFLNGEPK